MEIATIIEEKTFGFYALIVIRKRPLMETKEGQADWRRHPARNRTRCKSP